MSIKFSVGSIIKTDDAMSLELKTFLLNCYPTFANKEAKYFAKEYSFMKHKPVGSRKQGQMDFSLFD